MGRSSREFLAVVQHENLIREIADKLHVVLDPHDGRSELVTHSQQITREVFLLLTVQPRRWLIEQHQRRLCGEGPREANDLLHAVRQVTDRAFAVRLQLEEFDDRLDFLALLKLPAAAALHEYPGADQVVFERRLTAQQQVLQRGQLRKQLVVLERARDATLRCRVRGSMGDVGSLKENTARTRAVGSRNAIKEAGLAGPIRATTATRPAGSTASETSSSALMPPNSNETWATSRTAVIQTTSGCGDIV